MARRGHIAVVQRELDHHLVGAVHLATQAQVVAKINHVHHLRGQGVATGLGGACGIGQGDALGAHAALHRRANAGAVDVDTVQARAAGQHHFTVVALGGVDGGVQHGVVTDKAGHKAVAGGFVQPIDAVDLLDAAIVEHGNAVAHGQRFGLVVRHIDKGHAQLAVQGFELDLHMLAQLLVQRAQRLVHQHQLRVKHHGARQRHALLLAARHLAGVAPAHGAHLHHLQCALDFGVALGVGQLAHPQRVGNVLGHRHVRKQRVILEHHAKVALVRRRAGDGLAV